MENRNNWLIELWVSNTEDAYFSLKNHPDKIKKWRKEHCLFRNWFNVYTKCTDKIKWSEVDWEALWPYLEDLCK